MKETYKVLTHQSFPTVACLVDGGASAVHRRTATFSGVTAFCPRGACRSLASLLLAFSAMAFLFTGPISVAQDSKTPCRTARAIQRQSHRLYLPHVQIYRLVRTRRALCQRHSSRQTPQQRIRIHGSAAGNCGDLRIAQGVLRKRRHVRRGGPDQARKKENERARFEAEAGKTYYFKWTSGAMATGIKVTPVDPDGRSQRDEQTPSLQAP